MLPPGIKLLTVSIQKCLSSASNHMFGSGNFWNKSTSWFLKILKLPLFHPGYFKIFKIALGQFIPNRPPKHLITSTYSSVVIILCNTGLWKSAFCTYSIGKLVFRFDQNNTSKVKIKETTLKILNILVFLMFFFLILVLQLSLDFWN